MSEREPLPEPRTTPEGRGLVWGDGGGERGGKEVRCGLLRGACLKITGRVRGNIVTFRKMN